MEPSSDKTPAIRMNREQLIEKVRDQAIKIAKLRTLLYNNKNTYEMALRNFDQERDELHRREIELAKTLILIKRELLKELVDIKKISELIENGLGEQRDIEFLNPVIE